MRGRAMGIGSSKAIAVTFAGLIAVSVWGVQAAQGLERTTGIWKVLRAGHFSGPMNEEAHIRPIKGFIDAKGKRYRFWEYSWTYKKTHRVENVLLVFDQTSGGLSYLGYYEFEGGDIHGPIHPRVQGN